MTFASRLKRHPAEVKRLTRYRLAIDEISLLGIQVLQLTGLVVSQAAKFSRQLGLLTNDALVVMVMHPRPDQSGQQ